MKIVVAILAVIFGFALFVANKADDHMETMNDFKEEK